MAERAERTVGWLDRQVGMPETPPLFVLGADDWEKAATISLYGMPHVDSDRIVVGQEPAPFWSAVTGVITPLVDAEGLRVLQKVYGDPPQLGSFADLLVSHELSHLAHGARPRPSSRAARAPGSRSGTGDSGLAAVPS